MTISSQRLYLPKSAAEQYPQLSELRTLGLPSYCRWQYHAAGAQLSFDFELLAHGGIHYKQAEIDHAQQYFTALRDMIAIGKYTYTLLDLKQQTDVCARTSDGTLWIVDLHRESISTRVEEGRLIAERIPVFVEFLNSGCQPFERCMCEFLGLVSRFSQHTKNEGAVRSAWLGFAELVGNVDPRALEEESSFWQCIIGERLEAY